MKWNVSVREDGFTSRSWSNVEAGGPGLALAIALGKEADTNIAYQHGSDSAPKCPVFTVRPQEHVDIEAQRTAKEMNVTMFGITDQEAMEIVLGTMG